MKPQEARKKFRGPCVPIVTPFKKDYSLDITALKENINFLIEEGIKEGSGFLLIGGAGGEFPMLSLKERKKVAKAAVEEASENVPTIVGVQDTSTQRILELGKYAEEIGADAIQLSPPYYYEPSDEDVYFLFEQVSEEIDIGIMVYNTFWEGFNIGPELMKRLAELDNVVSFKWSAPTLYEYRLGLRNYADKLAMVDNMLISPFSHMLGCTGFITHVANYWPEHEVKLFKLMEEGHYKKALQMTEKLNFPWYQFRVKMAQKTGGEANVVKVAMELVGRKAGPPRPPTQPMNEEEVAELKEILEKGEVPLV